MDNETLARTIAMADFLWMSREAQIPTPDSIAHHMRAEGFNIERPNRITKH